MAKRYVGNGTDPKKKKRKPKSQVKPHLNSMKAKKR